jgi:hypothetical protein
MRSVVKTAISDNDTGKKTDSIEKENGFDVSLKIA